MSTGETAGRLVWGRSLCLYQSLDPFVACFHLVSAAQSAKTLTRPTQFGSPNLEVDRSFL